jgi:hypothetical protein
MKHDRIGQIAAMARMGGAVGAFSNYWNSGLNFISVPDAARGISG